MKHFKVLGPGCKNCAAAADLIARKAQELGVAVKVEKVTDMGAILGYGVMSTPGIVIDEKVTHVGSVPSAAQVKVWIAA